MEEIIAYKTADGKEFLDKKKAKYHESRLALKGLKEEFVEKAKLFFKDYLTEDTDNIDDGVAPLYFGSTFTDIEMENLEEVDDFVGFVVDIIIAYDGKVLEFMNNVSKEVNDILSIYDLSVYDLFKKKE